MYTFFTYVIYFKEIELKVLVPNSKPILTFQTLVQEEDEQPLTGL